MPSRRIARLWRGCGLAVLGSLALVAGTSAARDATFSVALGYEVDPMLRGCPSEAEFRRAVVQHLGYDPFRSEGRHRVVAQMQESERGIEGQVVWTDAAGNKEGERRLASPSRDCGEFVRGLIFAMAVQIQLLNSSAARDEPTAEHAPAASSAAGDAGAPPIATSQSPPRFEPTPIPLPLHADPEHRFVMAGLGPTAALGGAPSPNAGGRLFAALQRDALSLELGAEASFPVTFRQADGSGFSTTSFAVTLAPCGHFRSLGLCAVGVIGQMRVRGLGVDDPRSPASTVGKAGLRLVFDQPLSSRFVVRLHMDGLGTLTPRTVYLNDMPAWATHLIGFATGFDLAVLFR